MPVSLSSGLYTLTINLSRTGAATCQGGGVCASISVCAGTLDTMSVSLPVRVESNGDELRVIGDQGPKPLEMLIHAATVPATGTIAGTTHDPRGIFVEASGTLTATGSANPAFAASGTLDGQVTLGGGGCSNNGHTWTLSRT